MKKKIAIIGAGITGLTLAKFLSKKNYNISIYEKKSEIGGIMRDSIESDHLYFTGPHFLDPKSEWLNSFFSKNEINKNFIHFKENLYSYTDFFDKISLKENSTQPLILNNIKNIKLNSYIKKIEKKKNVSLKERINLYPKNISEKLGLWINNFSKETEKLDQSASEVYGYRVVFNKNFDQLEKLKKNKIFNKIYGRVSGEKETHIVPKNGFNDMFNHIEKNLLESGINIIKNVNLKSNLQKKEFSINNNVLNYDYLIWTANPIPLLKVYDKKLDNKTLNVKVYVSRIKKIKDLKPTYINVYSLKSKIFRIYVYNLDNSSQISVETFFDKKSNKKNILTEVKKIMKKLKININFIGKMIEKKEIRHIFLTQNDIKVLKSFKKNKPSNIIDGVWEKNFHREQKISFYKNYVSNNL